MIRLPRFLLTASALAGLLLPVLHSAPAASGEAFLFSSFQGKGDGLHFSYSLDGLHWTEIDRLFLKPSVGGRLFRDPHLLRGPDGIYHLLWTSGMNDKGVGYATSTDLVYWTPQRFLPLMKDFPANNCWAPEALYDPVAEHYVVTWTSHVEGWFSDTTETGHMGNRTYYSTTRDFLTFSDPALLIEPGFDHVDPSIVPWRGQYLAIFKGGDLPRQNQWGAHHAAIADSPTGPYRLLPRPIFESRGETCAVLPMEDRILFYLVIHGPRRVGAIASVDGQTWSDISREVAPSPTQSQGSILRVPASLLSGLGVR